MALRPAFAEIVAPDPIVAVTIPPADWNETEFCRSVRQTFDAFAAGHPGGEGGAASAGAAARRSRTARSAASARVYDVTVLSRPGSRGARMTALEAALFDSGRPVLMAPPTPPKTFGETVLIHWNASTETARVHPVRHADPAQGQARVADRGGGAHRAGPSVKDALGHLEANGIAATEKTVRRAAAGRARRSWRRPPRTAPTC